MKYAALAVALLCLSCSASNTPNSTRFKITNFSRMEDDSGSRIFGVTTIKDNETNKEFACFVGYAYNSISCVQTKP